MLFAAMLVNALHSALEDAVVAFHCVRIHLYARFTIGVAVLAARVINNVMLGKLIAKLGVPLRLIRHDVAFAVQIGANDRQNVLFLDAIDMKRASRAASLHKR
jgi:hypothetical protein